MRPGQEKKYDKAVRWMMRQRGMSAADARSQAAGMMRKGVNMGAWLEKAQSRFVKSGGPRRVRWQRMQSGR